MRYSFQKLCDRLSDSLTCVKFDWTSVWAETSGVADCLRTTGIIGDTKTLYFNDNNIYTVPKKISQLTFDEMVVKAKIVRSLGGVRLVVSTRKDPS